MTRPSNKIIILLIVAVLTVGGTFFFKNFGGEINFNPFAAKPTKSAETINPNAEQLAAAEINKDSDNDGLKDWEEKLWKTDPHNPDTDKDGTLDGEEVKEGRDPAVANTAQAGLASNDILKKETAIKNILENSAGDDTNSTDKLSQEFFTEYLSTKQSGGVMSDTDKTALIGQLVAKETSTASAFKKYTLSDLKALSDGSQEAIRTYGNTLGEIIITNSTTHLESELSILQTAITNQDKEKLKDLDPIISRYQAVIDKSLATAVPPTAMTLHLNFINAVSGLLDSITKMKSVIDDPLVSLKGLNIYSDSRDALVKSISDLSTYFKSDGVVMVS